MGPFQKDEQVGAMCTPSGLLSIIYRTCTRYYPKHFTSIKSINSPACSQKVLHPHLRMQNGGGRDGGLVSWRPQLSLLVLPLVLSLGPSLFQVISFLFQCH